MSTSPNQLDATIQALKGGLGQAAPVAGDNIDSWVSTLNGANSPALSAIADELKNLKAAVGSGDGSKISHSLSILGEHTSKAAGSATEDAKAGLKELGQILTDAAASLKA